MTVDQYERNTVVTVRRCERRDTGRYRLLLSNSSGQADTQADGVVLGRPSKPQVRISIILIKKSCKVVMIVSKIGRMSSKMARFSRCTIARITGLKSI